MGKTCTAVKVGGRLINAKTKTEINVNVNLMNQDPKDHMPIRKSSGWLALIALLALGFSAAAYNEVHQNINAGEPDLAMLEQLNQVARLHVMLSHLGNGQVEEIRQQLKVELAEDLAAVGPLVASAAPEPAGYARTVLTAIDRYQKAHPDFYLASAPSLTPEKIKVVSANRQVAASGISAH